MSYCRKEGKDTIIFATKEEHAVPSTVTIPEPEKQPGVVLPDGSINWNCPCLGGMATGPCGLEFREAFSCFHYSKAEPKGSECLLNFSKMQECMKHYPILYTPKHDDIDNFEIEDDQDEIDATVGIELENKNNTSSSEIEKK